MQEPAESATWGKEKTDWLSVCKDTNEGYWQQKDRDHEWTCWIPIFQFVKYFLFSHFYHRLKKLFSQTETQQNSKSVRGSSLCNAQLTSCYWGQKLLKKKEDKNRDVAFIWVTKPHKQVQESFYKFFFEDELQATANVKKALDYEDH